MDTFIFIRERSRFERPYYIHCLLFIFIRKNERHIIIKKINSQGRERRAQTVKKQKRKAIRIRMGMFYTQKFWAVTFDGRKNARNFPSGWPRQIRYWASRTKRQRVER